MPTSRYANPARIAFAASRALRWPCRCVCGRRRTLTQPPDWFIVPRRCRSCGKRSSLRIDWYRLAKEWRAKPCRCYGYSFPHAKGRGFCDHNPRLTAADLEERQAHSRYR